MSSSGKQAAPQCRLWPGSWQRPSPHPESCCCREAGSQGFGDSSVDVSYCCLQAEKVEFFKN